MSSSILTNMSAMSAVQSLNATQKSLADVQNEISTGLAVSSAQDNAAYYSIAQTMRTNVSDLSAVSSSLNLGASVVSTATAATSQITSVLQSISSNLVTAKSNLGNSDTQSYLQTAITSLNQQLASIVNSASFNGVNLLNGSASASVSFVSGISGSGASTSLNTLSVDTTSTNLSGADSANAPQAVIDYAKQASDQSTYAADQATFKSAVASLSSSDYTNTSSAFKSVFGANASYSSTTGVVTLAASADADTGSAVTLIGAGGTYDTGAITSANKGNYAAGTSGDLLNLGGTGATGSTTTTTVTDGTSGGDDATVTADGALTASQAALAKGALFNVGQIDLTTATSATIDSYISQVGKAITAVNSASENLGAASSQIDLQTTYISSLSSNLTQGVGSLVDADMNEASTRLSALQTQQQLGVQALSVANQNSQLILKLFGG